MSESKKNQWQIRSTKGSSCPDFQDIGISQYFKDIDSYPIISSKRQIELGKIIQGENTSEEEREKSKNELITTSLRLVVKFASNYYKRYANSPYNRLGLLDMIQAGNIGIINAVNKFNPIKFNVQFSTYAVPSICNSIRHAIEESRFIHTPEKHQEYVTEVKKLKEKYGDNLTDEIIIKETKMAMHYFINIVKHGDNSTISLEENEEFFSNFSDPNIRLSRDIFADKDLGNYLIKKLGEIKPIYRDIILQKYFNDNAEEVTMKKIGQRMGSSRQNIKFLLSKALKCLSHKISIEDVKTLNHIHEKHKKPDVTRRENSIDNYISESGEYIYLPNLTVDELKELSDEIRIAITDGNSVTMDQYVEKAKKVEPQKLGHRKIKAILKEKNLEYYLPSLVFEILKEKFKNVELIKFNKSDDDFMRKNYFRGVLWLASRFYSVRNVIHKRLKIMDIDIKLLTHKYTKEEEEFIRLNLSISSSKEISQKLNVSHSSMIAKIRRLKKDALKTVENKESLGEI